MDAASLMKPHAKKAVLDRLLNDWWVDLGVAVFILAMLVASVFP